MQASINVVTQWYRETLDNDALTFYSIWRNALRKFAPDVPIMMIHNGGPTEPPFSDIEIVPAIGMAPHERGAFGHYHNCWKSMTYAWELSRLRGISCSVFIGQNLIVGVPFVEDCARALLNADILFNTGCLGPGLAFTEYIAVNPMRTEALSKEIYRKDMVLLEAMLPIWSNRHRLREAPFPNLWRPRDVDFDPVHTFAYHLGLKDVLKFAAQREIPISS